MILVSLAYGSCSTTSKEFIFREKPKPASCTLRVPLLNAAIRPGLLEIPLMNPGIGSIFNAFFHGQGLMFRPARLEHGIIIAHIGPNHSASLFGHDRLDTCIYADRGECVYVRVYNNGHRQGYEAFAISEQVRVPTVLDTLHDSRQQNNVPFAAMENWSHPLLPRH
jgi:hypothetical protein